MKKFDKQKAIDGYKTSLLLGTTFLMGQLESCKTRFIDTGDNKFLDMMNNMYSTYKMVLNMDYEIRRLSKECRRLTKENQELKK
ncbi:MAG: hypothetical protein HRT87_12680 [Legionellales bacterium]|nr:hypothetical protein [Legionellales bacterium]